MGQGANPSLTLNHLTWPTWLSQPVPEANSQVLLWRGELSEVQPGFRLWSVTPWLPLQSRSFVFHDIALLPLSCFLASLFLAGPSPWLPSCGRSPKLLCLDKEMAHLLLHLQLFPPWESSAPVCLMICAPLSCPVISSMQHGQSGFDSPFP